MSEIEVEVIDSDVVFFLAETALHLMIIRAILAQLNTKARRIILWSGGELPNSIAYDWERYNLKVLCLPNYSKCSFLELDQLAKSTRVILDEFINRNCSLVTYYDTAYSFEIIRHILNVPWNRVALLDDGQANYLPDIGMPDYRRRWLKNVLNLILRRFPITTAKYNLGANKRIKLAYAVSPQFYYRGANQICIVDVSYGLRAFLNEQAATAPMLAHNVSSLVSLSPIYSYKRVSKEGLYEYLKLVEKMSDSGRVAVKVHPRDIQTSLVADLKKWPGEPLVVLPDVPTELFFETTGGINWFGAPSTSMLYRHFLYPERNDKFYISQFGTSAQFAEKQIMAFRDIMGEKFIYLKTSA